MVFMAYGILVFPIINLVYFLRKKKGIKILGYFVIVFYFCIFAVGTFNAWNPMVKTYNITIKKETNQKDISILMASDFHLSEIIKTRRLQRFVALSKELNPDIILLPGDIIDNKVAPYIKHNMGDVMKEINAPMGVYASLGNHENYGNDIPQIIDELEKAGITVLEDETMLINETFYLVGRKDFQDKNRKPINAMVKNLDKTKPTSQEN